MRKLLSSIKLLIRKHIKSFPVEAIGVPIYEFHVPGRFSGEVGYDKDDVYLTRANGFWQGLGKPQMAAIAFYLDDLLYGGHTFTIPQVRKAGKTRQTACERGRLFSRLNSIFV
jgi:hypothetical protein